MPEPFELVDEWELLMYAIALEQLKRQRDDVLSAAMFNPGYWDREYEIMAAAFAPALAEIMTGGIQFATPERFIPNVAELFENQRFYAEQHAAALIRNINTVTEEKVNALIQQSIVEGWDIPTLTDNLGEWFSEMRARRIAISETTDAFMGGAELSLNSLRGQGLNMVARWLTANDDRVCQICAPRHLKLQGDGWTDMRKAHVGCRCDIALEEIIL